MSLTGYFVVCLTLIRVLDSFRRAQSGGPRLSARLLLAVMLIGALITVAATDAFARVGRRSVRSIQQLVWTRIPGAASRVAVAPDGSLWALSDRPAGLNKFLWHDVNGKWIGFGPVTAASLAFGPDGTLYAAHRPDGVFAFNGKHWTPLGGPGLDALTVGADGTLFALGAPVSDGNRAIWKRAGSTWTRQPGFANQLVGSFDPATYALSSSAQVRALTAGPDGAVWFTEANAPNIGRITTAGTITEYPLPSGTTGVQGITAGPDGALWFALQDENAIGRMTTAGVVTEYPVPAPNTGPYGITLGPDGRLYFTESTTSIGVVTLP
jgi:hypothetical protein